MIPITVFSSKGGVGKTIISINISYQLGKRKIKTLLVDTDVQNNVALYLGEDVKEGLSEFILKDTPPGRIIHKTSFGFSYVPTGLFSMRQTVRYLDEINERKFQRFLYEAWVFCVEGGMNISINPAFLKWFSKEKRVKRNQLKRYLQELVNAYQKDKE
jgi:cellulose biosynthesis protein BcsQ